MSDPSNHPTDGEAPTVGAPATPAAPGPAPAGPVTPQTPPAPGPVPPTAPPPPPVPAPGGGWGYPPPPGGGRPGRWRRHSLALAIAAGLAGLLLGCLLGGAITLAATHWNDGYHRGPGHPAPYYHPRRGPGFAPYGQPGQVPKQKQPGTPAASPTS